MLCAVPPAHANASIPNLSWWVIKTEKTVVTLKEKGLEGWEEPSTSKGASVKQDDREWLYQKYIHTSTKFSTKSAPSAIQL